jgi:hemerythrin-like domain-containing protein
VNDPFEQLTRSHRRLEQALSALSDAARGDRLDEQTARDVADFLARQVKRHEADEEESLFPRLANATDVAAIVAQLRDEHVAQAALHERLERALANPSDLDEIRRVAIALEDAYRTHIDVEEAVLFPAARRSLSSRDLELIHGEMRARRDRGRDDGPQGGGRRGDRR